MKVKFKLFKRCMVVDKYVEVDASGNVDLSNAVIGTIYVTKPVSQGRQSLTITIEEGL